MESKTNSTIHSSLVCLVCGDAARGLNFDVLTCTSCKAFFRRHALGKTKQLYCQFNNDCIITQQTRSECSACRLKKCLTLRMNPELIRSSPRNSPKPTNNQQIISSQPTTLSLLFKDRSTLSSDEWDLLSNIIHSYDEQNLVLRTQCSLQEQSSLPLKLRSKPSNTLNLIGSFYTAIQPLLERSPFFHNLPKDVRQILVQNNLNGTGSFHSMFAAAEAKLFENEHHVAVCYEIYGKDYVDESQQLMTRMELNGTLIKLMLIILAFSSNCSIVLPEHISNSTNTSSTSSIILTRIQDRFIVVLWKYLVYRYGFNDAVRRLDCLIRNYLDVLNRINENNSRQHMEMVDIIVNKTAQSLTLEN